MINRLKVTTTKSTQTENHCVLSREVLQRVESLKFGANCAVVVEYIKALTVTGKIYKYCPPGKAVLLT